MLDIRPEGRATQKDFEIAVSILNKTQFRLFFMSIGKSFIELMESAVSQGLVGTAEHTWLLNSALFVEHIWKCDVGERLQSGQGPQRSQWECTQIQWDIKACQSLMSFLPN